MPSLSWGFGVSNLTGTPPAATVGTNFTAGASNTDGTSVSVISALSHDLHYLIVGIGGVNVSTGDGQGLLDILIDRAGGTSWSSFIDDLVCGFTPTPAAGTAGIQQWYHFPLFVPAGASLGVRARTAHTANITSGRVVIYGYGEPSRPDMWWCGTGVESLGINEASSKGTNVTPGNSGTYSSWTTIGTSSYRYGAVQFGVNGSDATASAIGYYWQIGYGSTQLPGSPTAFMATSTNEVSSRTGFGQIIWCNAPASTVWQLRATASGTAETYNAAIYGVY